MQRPDRSTFLSAGIAAGTLAVAALPQPLSAASVPADTILIRGRIATLDPKRPFVTALATSGSTVLATGSDDAMLAHRGNMTRVIDLQGRTVVPGLNDSHTHFIRTGINYAMELRWDGVPSLKLGLAMLRDQVQRTPAPFWIQIMGGFSAYQFAEQRLPTLDELNAAAPETPVYVLHLYDRALINRAGLRALGWDQTAPNVPGGFLERDAAGHLTGLLMSTTSIAAVVFATAKFARFPPDEQTLSTRYFMREMNRLGVTSLADAGGAGQNYPDNYASIMQLAKNDELTLRIAYSLFAQRPGKELEDYTTWVGTTKPGGSDFFRMNGGGEYLTWTSGDPASFAKDVVPNPPIEESQLTDVVRLIAAKGWPFRMHATYDETAARILGVLENVHREVPLDRLRWIIDHGETLSPHTLDRIAKMGGCVAVQNRMSLEGEAFLHRQGAEKAGDAPPLRRILDGGIPLAAGTDGTRATSYNPWIGLHWLITGKTLGGTQISSARNLQSRMDALRLYSSAGAYLTFEDKRKGKLQPGYLADLAVLSADYFSISDESIKQLESVLTMVGGNVVYAAAPFSGLAPRALPAMPAWLPINHYTGYARHDEHQSAMRANAVRSHDHGRWSDECGCAG